MIKTHPKRFYYKLVLFAALVGLFPVIVLGIYAAGRSSEYVRQALFQSDQEYLDSCRARMENLMESAENYYAYAGVQDEILSYTYKDLNFQDYDDLTQVRDFLRGGAYFQYIIDKVYLVNFQYSYVVGFNEVGKYELEDENNLLLQTLQENEIAQQTIFWSYLQQWDGLPRKYLTGSYTMDGWCLFIKLPMYITSRQAAIVLSLSPEKLSALFENGSGEVSLTVISGDGVILYDEDLTMVGRAYQEIPEFSQIDVFDWETPEVVDGNYLSYTQGERGLIYVKKTPVVLVSRAVNEIYRMVVLLCLLILGILAGTILFLSRELYRPVKSAYNKARILVQPEKQWGELKVIEQGLNLLSSENQQLQERVNQNIPLLQEFFLQKLLRGILPEEEIRQYQEIIGEKSRWQRMQLMVIWHQHADERGALGDYSRIFMTQLASQVIPEERRWQIVYADRGWVALIREEGGEDTRTVTQLAEEILSRAQSVANLRANIGISKTFEQLSEVNTAYQQSSNALFYKTFYEQELIVYTEPSLSQKRTEYPVEKIRELHSMIKNCNEEEALRLMRELAGDIFRQWRSPAEYRMYVMRMVSDILSAADELGEGYSKLYPDLPEICEKLAKLRDEESTAVFLYERMILPIIQRLSQIRSNNQDCAAQQLMEMIRKGYETDLTLEKCADELHYHPTYLWRIFKEHYGMTFAQCLDNVRFQKAKEWLVTTDLSVAEIGKRLCYSNAQNFIRSFKQRENMTPGKYRELHCGSE